MIRIRKKKKAFARPTAVNGYIRAVLICSSNDTAPDHAYEGHRHLFKFAVIHNYLHNPSDFYTSQTSKSKGDGLAGDTNLCNPPGTGNCFWLTVLEELCSSSCHLTLSVIVTTVSPAL